MDDLKCPDCKGSGKYVGLQAVEVCETCAGTGGRARYGISPLSEAIALQRAIDEEYRRAISAAKMPPGVVRAP
jgi:RecJ-like exonuclease